MKIICVGRNYAKHARELQNELPSEPVLFMKPETSIVPKKNPFFIPDFSKEVHYEAELVVRINRLGKHIGESFAHKYWNELTVGIDFTARDLQAQLKERGLPWEKAKAFDGSAAIGKFIAKDKLRDPEQINFALALNGKKVQSGNSQHMLYPVNQLISYISRFFTLKIGDLIFTGTPEGVGPVAKNDRLEAFLEDQRLLRVNVK